MRFPVYPFYALSRSLTTKRFRLLYVKEPSRFAGLVLARSASGQHYGHVYAGRIVACWKDQPTPAQIKTEKERIKNAD